MNTSGSIPNDSANSTDFNTTVRRLNALYEPPVGHKPENQSTIPEMARYLLASGATIIDIAEALDRCVRECQYPIRLPDIMQRIPGNNVPQPEAEMRAAWDSLMQFTNKYVEREPSGGVSS